VLGAVAAATAFLSLREAATEHGADLVVWMLCATSSAVAFVWMLATEGARFDVGGFGAREWGILLGVAFSGLFGQLWMTRAYKHLPASIASALGLTALLWGVLFEIAFSGARPAVADWCGYALIVAGAFVLRRVSPRGSPDEEA
jgi:drug/metabolite transporter (DMT)-like permease